MPPPGSCEAAPDFATQGRPGDSADAGAGTFGAYDDMPQAYKDAVDLVFSHFGKAIHAYERLIVSTNSDFDKFVAGQPSGFSLAAQRGLKVFIGKGQCTVCHGGKEGRVLGAIVYELPVK